MAISDFLLFAKNGIVVGVRSLKVTARPGCCYEYTIVSVPRIARRYTIQSSLPNTHTVNIELDGDRQAGIQAGREAEKERGRMEDGREGARGGWANITYDKTFLYIHIVRTRIIQYDAHKKDFTYIFAARHSTHANIVFNICFGA